MNNNGQISVNGGIGYKYDDNLYCSGGFGRIRIDCPLIINKGKIIPNIAYNKYNK